MKPIACLLLVATILVALPALGDDAPLRVTVNVDAGTTLRTMNPQRLGGSNVAMWVDEKTYAAPEVRQWIAELHPGFIRLPGGSWSNCVYWNGNGVRAGNGLVDPTRVGPDGYSAVDYAGYAPSFTVEPKTLHPTDKNWHGHIDVKGLHEFIQAIAGAAPLPCLNAGTGRPIDAAEWVKWANKKMGFDARDWEIGNELDGSWEPGYYLPDGKGTITAEMYTKRYNDIAAACRAVDPSIKIGGCAFAEAMVRDCGENVNFVSIHSYPGSAASSNAQMFADVGKTIEREVGKVRGWIRQYQPQREKQIEVAYTEWNLGFSVSASQMFSGLWASIFLGEMARNGVDFATQWDCFTHSSPSPDGHALIFTDGTKHTRKAEYYALWLWNNYMLDRLIPVRSSDNSVYTYASRSDDAVTVMLINTDYDRDANVSVQLSDFDPADSGEIAAVTSREYYWNPLTHLPQWSTGPRIDRIKTGASFDVSLPPFSMTCVRIPGRSKPQKVLVAKQPPQQKPELRFVLPSEAYIGDEVHGDLMVLGAGTDQPFQGALAPATLKVSTSAELDRREVRLAESLGHFTVKPSTAGDLTITAQSGDTKATHTLKVKPSVPRPVVLWDFAAPPLSDRETFSSDFKLAEDSSQRANRAVARVDLPSDGVVPSEKLRRLLQIQLPDQDKLKKENIRGVIFDVMASSDFSSDDPAAGITVVMQSSANWWMQLEDIPLKNIKQWKTCQVDVKLDAHIKAMPAAINVWFVLKADKPVKGSIYFDRVGLMLR
jgi:alpha-L-arabinofuranosidase